ncbi:Zinc phosphodiesterase ELAC protein 2 [Phytophthora citrophthora]|uniref:ribonuclease Z n=1 Tax=Phytophthora citrophthora TaxID=4793 RepID=A0AAD9H044_9STRA|nr:Zinc phosphodiesterase ELAC protein 2 [Phytophthora citrophthora]
MAALRSRVSVIAEVVGTGSDGTEPSLLFSVQHHGQYSADVKVLKRYLFNCGEGTQRLAGENGIKLSSLDAMYFTRFDIKSVSGVPGVIFALGSCGTATLKLHGPVGIRGFLSAIRSFVRRKYPQIQCIEITAGNEQLPVERDAAREIGDQIEYENWDEGTEQSDQHAVIIPVSLGCSGSSHHGHVKPNSCILCEKNSPKRSDEDISSSTMPTRSTTKFGRLNGDESVEHMQFREWLVQYYTEKVPVKLPYVDVVLNRYRGRYDDLKAQLYAKYGELPSNVSRSTQDSVLDPEASSDSDSGVNANTAVDYANTPLDRMWLEKFYAAHQPEKVVHIDRVLRQFSEREDTLKQMLLKKYAQNTETEAQDEHTPRKKRKVKESSDVEQEKPTVDPIPKLFTSAEGPGEIPLEDSSSSLCYVLQFLYAPYPVIWIIDCRSSDQIEELERKFSAMAKESAPFCDSHLPSLVVHLSPGYVQALPRYKQWIASLIRSPLKPEQLVFNAAALQKVEGGAFSYAFVSSAKVAVQREIQIRNAATKTVPMPRQPKLTAIHDLATFMEESSWSPETPCQRKIVQLVNTSEIEAHVAQSKLQFCLLSPNSAQLGFNYERTGWHLKVDASEDENDGDITRNPMDNSSSISASSLIRPPRNQVDLASSKKLIVLGTGSAAPSKLRASSGMYLELSGTNSAGVDSMLVDCGEATFGQLWRQFGSDVSERIGGLRCIWISHNHADHHCGLVRVLYEYWNFQAHRKDGKLPRPLVVVAPQSVLSYVESWLPQFLRNDTDQRLIHLATCSDFNNPDHPVRHQLLTEIGYAVSSITSVRVFHCYDSYGLVLTLNSGKKLVYSGDTKPCNDLVLAGMGAELLVHEATFDDSMGQDAQMKKHSTVSQALEIARRMRARQVVLTHFSQRYPSLPPPVSNSSMDNVLCAYDGFRVLTLMVPCHLSSFVTHRMEIRSLSKAMCEGGSFKAVWVQSHKEHEQAFACVDSYAKASHCQVMVESYSTWMDFDHYLLLDDELRPVVGNTLQYLFDRAQADLRRGWIEKQSRMPPSRHTMTTDEIPLTNTEEARMNILHTNSVKHKFDHRWPETCLLCDSGDRDTQDHRFGLEQPCPEVVQLESMLTDLYYRLDQEYFFPDQSILLPSLGHDAAKRVAAPTRDWWYQEDESQNLWRPMVALTAEFWVHGFWLTWIEDPEVLLTSPGFVGILRRELQVQNELTRNDQSCLLPMAFVGAVRICQPQVGPFHTALVQLTPGWASVIFERHDTTGGFKNIENLIHPAEYDTWRFDDVWVERSKRWWDKFQRQFERQQASRDPIYWVATTKTPWVTCTSRRWGALG